jgi:hypothetical protein
VPDFTISLSAPNPATVIAGSPTAYKVTVSPVSGSGFIANVALAAQGLPAGATASFIPAAVSGGSGTSTMTVTSPVSLTAAAVMGTSGTLSHMAAAQGVLTVQDFTLTVTPSSSSSFPWVVTAGQTLNFAVSAVGVNGFSSALNLYLNLPGYSVFGGTVTTGSGSATITWVIPANTAGGAFNYSISAQLGGAGGLSHSVTGQLSVAAQNFSVSLVQTPIVMASWPGSANFTMTLTSINNFAGPLVFGDLPFSDWVPFYAGVNGPVYAFPPVTLTAGGTTTANFSISFGSSLVLPYGPGPYGFAIVATGAYVSNPAATVSNPAYASVTFGSNPGSVLSSSSTHSGSFSVGQSRK